MSTFARLAELPLRVDGYRLAGLELVVSPAFTRRTTLIRLEGAGACGVGEDVSYGQEEQLRLQADGPRLPLAGHWTLASFSEHLRDLPLFSAAPSQEAYRDYRRWAFESAALDLALVQTQTSLAALLEREPRPLTFVASLALGHPPTAAPIRARLRVDPTMRFKLDATDGWDAALMEELAALARVDVIDLKGAYRGTPVDQAPNRELYAGVVRNFPEAWIEDPGRTTATDEVLAGHWDRVTWDAPIHSTDDVLALEHTPRALNVKPSRFGALQRLCDFYDYCAAHDIALYGGGQFELDVGRDQIQLLASLFHPDAPNDTAPAVFHAAAPDERLPTSPLAVRAGTGFRLAGPRA